MTISLGSRGVHFGAEDIGTQVLIWVAPPPATWQLIEEETDPPAWPEPPGLGRVREHLDALVVGQSAAKRVLSAGLTVHLRGLNAQQPPAGPRRILLVGPRGTGKTELVQALATFDPRLPSHLAASSSRLTETGYVGENLENLPAAPVGSTGRARIVRATTTLDARHPTGRDAVPVG